MREVDWISLVESLQVGRCVLVLGPDIPAVRREGTAGVSDGSDSVRDAFCQYLVKYIEAEGRNTAGEQVLFSLAQQYDDSRPIASLKNIAANFFRTAAYDQGPLHEALARCPFSLVLTTCHDALFAQALRAEGKSPSRYWYHYRGEQRDNREVQGMPTIDAPVIYYLYGAFDEPSSLVLTENDLLDFMISVISGKPKLPASLLVLLKNNTFLFVGFGIRHWYIRVLLKLLIRSLEISSGSFALESFNELEPREREQTVLFYSRGTRIEVVNMEALTFTQQLLERLDRAGGYFGPVKRRDRRPQVFICHERSDANIAKSLYEALPKDRVEAWLDSSLLHGGEDWNQELEDRIRFSDYFLVLNSINLANKKVGYVNKELDLALDLQKYRQRGIGFIIPLRINDITAEAGQASLKRFEQPPLRPNFFDADVSDITKTICRDFQKLQQRG